MNNNDGFPQTKHRTPDDREVIAEGQSDHLSICSLVLNAVGIPHRIDLLHSTLTVPVPLAAKAKYHLDRYFEENANWPEPPPEPVPTLTGSQPTLLMIGGLAVFYLVTGPWNDRSLWFTNGAINSLAILEQKEWWRLVTALTLHADLLHLAGNCIIGGFLVHLLVNILGSGTGWLLLIVAGASGNLLNIAMRESVHLSVGFSTSIFGVIGLFSGLQMLSTKNYNIKNLIIPLGAGAGLLAMLGAEGERTDLGAHLFGFLCGILLGCAAARLALYRLADNTPLQRFLLLVTMSLIIICWLFAMN